MNTNTPAPTYSDGRIIIALVATQGRPELLSRAIPSILSQTRLPDRILVVVDREKAELPERELRDFSKSIHSACGGRLRATVIRNVRTLHRASGAWNTGIDFLHRDERLIARPDLCFVAILDDDDAWEADHLRICLEQAVSGDLSMVAAGILRHESPEDQGVPHEIPPRLDPQELFVRGQHIQGSNLFVRLDAMLKVGGFDEYLPSCTDRDLCIRLSDLDDIRFGRVPHHTVHHFADPRPDRLSTPASSAKLDGLTRFWRKHAGRFGEDAQRTSAARAAKLFGWTPPVPEPASPADVTPPPPARHPVDLVVGFVTDAQVPMHVAGLLEDLLSLARRPDIASLKVVVVENGPLPDDGARPLHILTETSRERGLDLDLATLERQRSDWSQGRLLDTPDPASHRLPIAVTRSILNTYVARAATRPGAWAWILDDDKRLNIRIDRGDGSVTRRASPDLRALESLRESGVDVVIGPDTDAAPLPFTATLRVQLVDLLHHLQILSLMRPEDAWDDRRRENAMTRAMLTDYYYDLSRHTEHLETPFRLPPDPDRGTAAGLLRFLGTRVDRLLAGEQVFRPLVIEAQKLLVEAATPSVQRGGSAIFFKPSVLLEFPHSLARFGNRFVRRSDMLVSQIMRDQLGLNIVMHPAAGVQHDRSDARRATLNDETLWGDVLGYALYRAADELMGGRTPRNRRDPLLSWNASELKNARRLVRKYIDERLATLTLNSWRIVGLAGSIRKATRQLAEESSPWSTPEARAYLDAVTSEMNRISGHFMPHAVAVFAEGIRRSVTDADIRNTFTSMDGLTSEYRATHTWTTGNDRGLPAARQSRASTFLQNSCAVTNLTLLGAGNEGIVFTDHQQVYKVFDLLKRRPNHDTLETLQTLRNRLDRPKHLYPLLRVEVLDETLLIVYPYEPTEPYTGGHGADFIDLLRECKTSGIIFRNMHPKNLRVSPTGLKLVDYGADVRPYSEGGYRSMAERAWLTWRWSHRKDLEQLMRRALTDKSLPELDGFERFWTALCDEAPSATRIVSGIIEPLVLNAGARSVLDYGCGKKIWSARRLAEAGLPVVGYDPGAGMNEQWETQEPRPPGLELTTDRRVALSHGPFDAVVCSIVLCELEDGPRFDHVLRDLRSSVSDGGQVLITICSPFATFGGPSSLHRRRDLPEGATYEDSFPFYENAQSGTGRREFHRPLRRIEAELLRHGLSVTGRIESRTVDLERFEPATDFLTLVCRPGPLGSPSRSVSLVIKTCAMEARTIERQVEHLVGQLSGPLPFHERILAIDSLRAGFVRQHADADWEGLLAAAQRLRARGLIDRVVQGPTDGETTRQLHHDWFGIESAATHTVRGYPLATPLSGFGACTGEYILQVDSDLLVGRRDRSHDYLSEMIEALEASPRALTASLNIAGSEPLPFSEGGDEHPWRVEVRGCLFHRARLLAARPFANSVVDGRPELSWHRAMDASAERGAFLSLRGGGRQTFFIHPPNDLKRSVSDWMTLIDLIENGHLSEKQPGKVDLVGGILDWVPRNRREPFIFVITGRDVAPSRIRRCLESLAAQHDKDWGAVLINDGSRAESRDILPILLKPWKERITLLQPRERRGQLANMTLAIRRICTNPESVIVTLDLDDTLIGPGVLDRLAAEYDQGADVTIGSMLRTDKLAEYPITVEQPRKARGGNVWQHLRSFRKSLFDAIPDQDLRLEGRYVDIAVDWAFMIPIVEMAKQPAWIRDPLYLYEPSGLGKGPQREARELQIAEILRKPSRKTGLGPAERSIIRREEMTPALWEEKGGILFVRHAERPSFSGLNIAEKDAVRLTDAGRASAAALGQAVGTPTQVFSSPILRSRETAEAIAEGAGLVPSEIRTLRELVHFRVADEALYESVKARLSWTGLMSEWTDGSLVPGILIPCHEFVATALAALRAGAGDPERGSIVAVTHDFMLIALLSVLQGVRITAVPYLGAVLVPWEIAHSFLNAEAKQ